MSTPTTTTSTTTMTHDDILSSLPPLSDTERASLRQAVQQDLGWPAEAWERYEQRTCHIHNDNATVAATFKTNKVMATGPWADAVAQQLQAYADERYPNNVTFRHELVRLGDHDDHHHNQLKLYTYAQLWEPSHQSGYWATECDIVGHRLAGGTLTVHVHNFESSGNDKTTTLNNNNNVQFRASRPLAPQETMSSSSGSSSGNNNTAVDADGKALVRHWQGQVERLHEDLLGIMTQSQQQSQPNALTAALKRVRRILPMTHQRMNWSDTAHESVAQLRHRTVAVMNQTGQ